MPLASSSRAVGSKKNRDSAFKMGKNASDPSEDRTKDPGQANVLYVSLNYMKPNLVQWNKDVIWAVNWMKDVQECPVSEPIYFIIIFLIIIYLGSERHLKAEKPRYRKVRVETGKSQQKTDCPDGHPSGYFRSVFHSDVDAMRTRRVFFIPLPLL
jgi:hypothetical protein